MGVKKKEVKITDDFSVSVEITGPNAREIVITCMDNTRVTINLDLVALDKLLRILRDSFVALDSYDEDPGSKESILKLVKKSKAEEDL